MGLAEEVAKQLKKKEEKCTAKEWKWAAKFNSPNNKTSVTTDIFSLGGGKTKRAGANNQERC